MAHHNNTPARVLNAPVLRPLWVHENTLPNRQHLRHAELESGRRVFIKQWRSLRLEVGANTPYRKFKATRRTSA